MSDLRWTDDQWALTWTAGFLRPDQEGPLPWWLSDHRNERNARGELMATTHPQMKVYRADWSA